MEIYEADVNPATSMAGNFLKLFYGELDSAEYEPPFIAAKVSTLSYIFARKIPRRLYQKTDNWCLFEEPNGLRPADWKWNAKVASYDPDTGILVVGTITSTNTAVIEENYFTYGYLIVTTAGKHQVRMISSNSVIAAGVMTVHLSNFLETAPAVDDVLALYPGYDGQAYTAGLKFHNYQTNFGGFPFMPTDNPTILKISTSSSTTK